MSVRTTVALVVVAGLLGGCSGGDDNPAIDAPDEAPSACVAAMQALEAEPLESPNVDRAVQATLNECHTVDEWLAALRLHPGAMGLTERAEIGDLDVQVACGRLQGPVCDDARQRGIAP